jgi:hypothetical protein
VRRDFLPAVSRFEIAPAGIARVLTLASSQEQPGLA